MGEKKRGRRQRVMALTTYEIWRGFVSRHTSICKWGHLVKCHTALNIHRICRQIDGMNVKTIKATIETRNPKKITEEPME